jgi:hypothetical protein
MEARSVALTLIAKKRFRARFRYNRKSNSRSIAFSGVGVLRALRGANGFSPPNPPRRGAGRGIF